MSLYLSCKIKINNLYAKILLKPVNSLVYIGPSYETVRNEV